MVTKRNNLPNIHYGYNWFILSNNFVHLRCFSNLDTFYRGRDEEIYSCYYSYHAMGGVWIGLYIVNGMH